MNFFSAHRHLHEPAAFRRYLTPAWNAEWVVYAKRPFAGPAQVLDYVGRYTHRVAISNNRLLSMDNGKVRFRWKDYRDDNRQKTMTLAADEFIRRFLIHVLPDGFHRIRYFGFLSNCHRAQKLALCHKLLGMAPAEPATDPPADYRDRFEALTGQSLRECPHCHTGIMVVTASRDPKSVSRFRIHHDPASAHQPHEPAAPARSGCGRSPSDSHSATRPWSKQSDPACDDGEKARLPRCKPPIRRPECSDGAPAEEAAAFKPHSLAARGAA